MNLGKFRMLWIALLATAGVVVLVSAVNQSGTAPVRPVGTERAAVASQGQQVSAPGGDRCTACHQRTTPGIVAQHLVGKMAASGVKCADCHEVAATAPGALDHNDFWVIVHPTSGTCAKCHPSQARQFWQSRHSIPAYAAMVGTDALSPEAKAAYDQIAEANRTAAPQPGDPAIGFSPRNALYALEQPVTEAACERCHNIGKENIDGSMGSCNPCHSRHQFSLEQVRKPETCNRCHIGRDHPHWEIYHESKHGIQYLTLGDNWNWTAVPGRLTVQDFPAPTCQLCHMGGFGNQPTTHDTGDRLSYFLFAAMSKPRPNGEENRAHMQDVCLTCHSPTFVDDVYAQADMVRENITPIEQDADKLMKELFAKGLITDKPYDHPIKFVAFDLWHDFGRTAKFAAYMDGPDYVQWVGIYPIMDKYFELYDQAQALCKEAGVTCDLPAPRWPAQRMGGQ